LVAFDLSADGPGSILWDSQKDADEPAPRKRAKDRDKADDGEPSVRLSFVGRPVLHEGRVFCGAWNADAPNETWAVAFDAGSGKLLWKRPLAVSEPSAAGRGQPNNPALPRALPCPALSVAKGALVVCSGNGV